MPSMFTPAPRAAINKKQMSYLIDISTNITQQMRQELESQDLLTPDQDIMIALLNYTALHHFIYKKC